MVKQYDAKLLLHHNYWSEDQNGRIPVFLNLKWFYCVLFNVFAEEKEKDEILEDKGVRALQGSEKDQVSKSCTISSKWIVTVIFVNNICDNIKYVH